MMQEQHNDHCRVTAEGRDWWITEIDGRLMHVQRPIGYGHCFTVTTIDNTNTDWNAYCEMAAAWLAEQFP